MQVSEARLASNRLNALKSRGPVTPEGRERARMNAVKHSLTAEVLIPPGDAEEIQARVEALTLEMQPKTQAGGILISMMATFSVRMKHAAEHEIAQTSMGVRHAADAFDDERFDRANALFETLADDPRIALRKLKRTPEGVERLIEAWSDLLADLTLEPGASWTDEQLEQAANLSGMKSRHAKGSRWSVLNQAIRGDFAAVGAEADNLAEPDRKSWAKSQLIDLIEAEVVALHEHYETLDFDTIAMDRAEAGARALFDASKPACLARRYEADARRGFFKALKEFRQVEAEFAAHSEPVPSPQPAPQAGSRMGSFRQTAPPPPPRSVPDTHPTDDFSNLGENGQPLVYVPPVKSPA